jgi:hypothetical protein
VNRRQFLGASLAATTALFALRLDAFVTWCKRWLGTVDVYRQTRGLVDEYEYRLGRSPLLWQPTSASDYVFVPSEWVLT